MKKNVSLLLLTLCLLTATSVQGQLRIWNLSSLEKAKQNSSASTKWVVRNADVELTKTLVTVMDKKMTPVSGDKHDYISMGKYWWPNPNTADGLPYIRKDGVSNPEIDQYDRGSLGDMAKGVTNLSLAYYLTSNEKYARKAVENLRIWFINKDTRMNPNMNFGQTIPGHFNGKGRGEGMIDTYSFVEMLESMELLKKSTLFTPDDQKAIKAWFASFLEWMQTSDVANQEFEAKNNHGTAFDVQMVRYAIYVGKEDVALRFINEFPARRMFKQIEPNGAQPLELARTKAFGYSVFNITHFLDMCMIAKSYHIDLYGAKSADDRCIEKAIDFLVPFAVKPLSEFPYQQIVDWDKVIKDFWRVLYRANQFKPNPNYLKLYELHQKPSDYSIYDIIY